MSLRIGSSCGRGYSNFVPAAALDVDLDGSGVERARTVERVEGGEVVEHLGPHPAEQVAHAGRLELEDAVRASVREEPVDLGVVERDRRRGPGAFPVFFSTKRSASSRIVSVMSPRKSILRRPIRSTDFISNWVVISSLLFR